MKAMVLYQHSQPQVETKEKTCYEKCMVHQRNESIDILLSY